MEFCRKIEIESEDEGKPLLPKHEHEIKSNYNKKVSKIGKIPSDTVCTLIFHPVYDTSQTYIIRKYLLKEQAIKSLETNCPDNIKIIAIYGISTVMKKFIDSIFKSKVPKFPETEGVYLYSSIKKQIGVLVFNTPDEERYMNDSNQSSDRFVTIIRILTDLSQVIVACISNEMIEKWFHEENGLLNPFKPKIHMPGKVTLNDVSVQESKIEKLKVSKENTSKLTYIIPRCSLKQMYVCSLLTISKNETSELEEKIKNFPKELLKLRLNSEFNIKLKEFFEDMKFVAFDGIAKTKEIRKLFEKMMSEKMACFNEISKTLSKIIDINFECSLTLADLDKDYQYSKRSDFEKIYFKDSSDDEKSSDQDDNSDKNLEANLLELNDEESKESTFRVNSVQNKRTDDIKYENWIKNLLVSANPFDLENVKREIKIKLASNFKIKTEFLISSFSEKYFDMYSNSFKYKDYVKIVELLTKDLQNRFNFIQLNSYSCICLKKSIFQINQKNLVKNLEKNKQKSSDLFIRNSIEAFINLIDTPKSFFFKDLMIGPLEKCKNIIKNIENKFITECGSILKSLKPTFPVTQISISKVEYEITRKYEKDLFYEIKGAKYLFKEFFKSSKIIVTQIISLDPDVIFVLLQNTDINKTHIIRFNPEFKTREDYEVCKDIKDSNVNLAWGSTSNKFIMFQNTKKIATQGCLKLNKYLQKGSELDIYSKVNEVVSSFYMNINRKLVFIDETGTVYYKDLVSDNSKVYTVRSHEKNVGSDKLNELRPVNDSKYIEIDVSQDENVIFLRTETEIEIFDKNFVRINLISFTMTILSYGSIFFENQCFLLVNFKSNKIHFFKIITPKKETQIENTSLAEKKIKGNPIFDLHHIGIIKFGPLSEETQIIKGPRSLGYFTLDTPNKKILAYLKGLKSVALNFDIIGEVNPNEILEDIDLIDKNQFIFTTRTRVPLQIASIQSGNLIPLQNGINNFEKFTTVGKNSTLNSLTSYIKFGNYEEILKNIKNILVISIIGKQSSGKSYLLNRLAGTRFDVAAERCTDGIWMGAGYIEEIPVIVFDCEGLFTVERSTQEEIKLCLFISSLSDLIILNSDLSSGKHIKGLFDEFAMGVDRLKGKNLFGGILDITYRDIPDNQGPGAKLEFESFLKNLIDSGRKNTLLKLFNKNIKNSLYHNFENELFNDEVEQKRAEYIMEIKKKWPKDIDFSLIIKTVLAQIFLDETGSVDINLFISQTNDLKATVEKIINNPEKFKKHLNNEVYKDYLQLGPKKLKIKWSLSTFYKDEIDQIEFFKDSLFVEKNEKKMRKFHNDLFKEFDRVIKLFFDKRKSLIVQFYLEKVMKSDEFQDQIEDDVRIIESKLDSFSKKFIFCLKKCEKCDFCCSKFINHTEDCDCSTDHMCKEFCIICGEDSTCSLLNGHKNYHVCKKLVFKCTGKCKLANSDKANPQNLYHEGVCKCKSDQACTEKCEMYLKCGNLCRYENTVDHKLHNCEEKCLFKCIFNDGNNCSSLNHLHDLDLVEETSNIFNKTKKHLCGTAHKCTLRCQNPGICKIEQYITKKIYRNNHNEFKYSHIDLVSNKLMCKELVQPGEIAHKNYHHNCGTLKHNCEAQCPDCNCYCDQAVGHSGLHSSNIHRNKDCSKFISEKNNFTGEILEGNKKRVVTFNTGELATPYTCDQYCMIKNRGHCHLIRCMGNDLCLEVIDKKVAEHSYTTYKSESNEDYFYDLVTCEVYWNKLGWAPPYAKSPQVQKIFGKCNFFCDHPSHTEKVYCELNHFHSISLNYNDHSFKCSHLQTDFIFITDISGSMTIYSQTIKKLIIDLVTKLGNNINKFAFIGYSDHAPGNSAKNYSQNFVFPESRDLNDGNLKPIIEYVNKVTLTNEGNNGGEAMIDALKEANNLKFQSGSNKVYFVIADESPHGKEFSSSSVYQNGCPCGISWRDELKKMKETGVEFIIVKLSNNLDRTVEIFKEFYVENFKVMTIPEVAGYNLNVANRVNRNFESNFTISNKIISI